MFLNRLTPVARFPMPVAMHMPRLCGGGLSRGSRAPVRCTRLQTAMMLLHGAANFWAFSVSILVGVYKVTVVASLTSSSNCCLAAQAGAGAVCPAAVSTDKWHNTPNTRQNHGVTW